MVWNKCCCKKKQNCPLQWCPASRSVIFKWKMRQYIAMSKTWQSPGSIIFKDSRHLYYMTIFLRDDMFRFHMHRCTSHNEGLHLLIWDHPENWCLLWGHKWCSRHKQVCRDALTFKYAVSKTICIANPLEKHRDFLIRSRSKCHMFHTLERQQFRKPGSSPRRARSVVERSAQVWPCFETLESNSLCSQFYP